MPSERSRSARSTPKRARRSGLQDIADQVGVSLSLVSKVLNNRLGTTGASQAMVKAIHDKASELNYRKNTTASSLATGRQSAIGVFIHRHGVAGSNISASLVEGISSAAARLHQRLMLQYYTTLPELADILPLAHRNVVDGLLLGGVPHRDLINELRATRHDLPLITAHSGQDPGGFINVGVDQPEVMRVATKHLIERGCRRIACVNNSTEMHRIKGYEAALKEAGIPYRPELVYPGMTYTSETGEQAAAHWLASNVALDGIVGQSDQHIAGVVKVLMQAGVKIPEQVRLIGIDNSPFCDFFVVPLSSVSQEEFRRGELAVETLLDAIEGKPVKSVTVSPVVHARRSSD
jgi:LacI family transcriptional regulator